MIAAAWLALVAGSADAAGWVLSGVFAAHMTGNSVLLGVSLADGKWRESGLRLAMVAASFLGFGIGAWLLARSARRVVTAVAAALALGAACMRLRPEDAILLATALAMQNAAYHKFEGSSVNISFLTGNLQALGSALFGADHDRGKRRVVPAVWLAYVAGGAATALIARHVTHPLLPAALGLVAFAAIRAARRAD